MAENPNYQMGISHSANEFAKWKKIRIKAGLKSKPNQMSALQSIYFLGAISGYSLQVLSRFAPSGLFVAIRGAIRNKKIPSPKRSLS